MITLKKQELSNLRNKGIDLFSTINIMQCNYKLKMIDYNEFFNQTVILSFLHDEDLINTILSFLENNLNISVTSKKTFMHRNTLVYRIEKVKKLTGFDVKKFDDASVIKNMITFYKNCL